MERAVIRPNLKNEFANMAPNGNPIDTPSTCMYYLPPNISIGFIATKFNTDLNFSFVKLYLLLVLRMVLHIILVVSARGIFVKKAVKSKLVMKELVGILNSVTLILSYFILLAM